MSGKGTLGSDSVDGGVGSSVARSASVRFVYRYDWSIENVSGDGRQRGTTGTRTVELVASGCDVGKAGRLLQCAARTISCVGKRVTLRFCAAELLE